MLCPKIENILSTFIEEAVINIFILISYLSSTHTFTIAIEYILPLTLISKNRMRELLPILSKLEIYCVYFILKMNNLITERKFYGMHVNYRFNYVSFLNKMLFIFDKNFVKLVKFKDFFYLFNKYL